MSKINIELRNIILALVKQWEESRGYTAYSINSGNCETFAMELQEAVEASPTLKSGHYCMMWGEEYPELFEKVCPRGHCFFKFEDKYYDSETPNGVTNPEKLPLYRRNVKFTGGQKCDGCKGCND